MGTEAHTLLVSPIYTQLVERNGLKTLTTSRVDERQRSGPIRYELCSKRLPCFSLFTPCASQPGNSMGCFKTTRRPKFRIFREIKSTGDAEFVGTILCEAPILKSLIWRLFYSLVYLLIYAAGLAEHRWVICASGKTKWRDSSISYYSFRPLLCIFSFLFTLRNQRQ